MLGAQNRSKLTERMKAADLPFLYPGYLLHQASPGCKPGISEHAPVMLFMPIYFVLGQHDVQSPSRHDSEVCPDLLRGEGSTVSLGSVELIYYGLDLTTLEVRSVRRSHPGLSGTGRGSSWK